MSNRIKLPLTREFPMSFRAHFYPSPEGGTGVTVQGPGYWKATFEQTENSQVARVRIDDIWVKLLPSRIPFDINRDGQLESIDLGVLDLGPETFDLEKSGGEYNLENGHIIIHLVFSVSPDALGPLGKKLNMEPVPFELIERGWLDLETGSYWTYCGLFTVRDGPFAGLTIMGDWLGPGELDKCQAKLCFGAGVLSAPTTSPTMNPCQAPQEIWISPKTPIVLVWEAWNANNVTIKPGIGMKGTKGYQLIPDAAKGLAAIVKDTIYDAETRGECMTDQGSVSVNVVQTGREIPQSATYKPEHGHWSAYLPPICYDQNILIEQVLIDGTKPNSVTYTHWRLDHTYSVGPSPVGMTFPPTLNTWDYSPQPFCFPGQYIFTPQGTGIPPQSDLQRKVYFRLRVK